jgi:glycosyltransferase involved in cell wall biosynthesis
MKIVLLQDRLRLGGTEVQCLALGRAWAARGAEVRLVVFRPGGDLAERPEARELNPVFLQKRDWGLDRFAPRLRATVEKIAPDVVVAFGREANAKLPLFTRLTPRPLLVATLRSGRPQPGGYWRALLAADAVVANAQWAAGDAEAHGVSKDRIHLIRSGLSRAPFAANPADARADWRTRAATPADAVVILCVAGFRPGKGQDVLLRAAALLPKTPPWQLWLAGDGPRREPCQKLARELGLADAVRFLGAVDNPAGLYAAADVAALASQAEALPNFLIEAQAAGLPVVATAVGGVTECFDDGRTGLAVPPGEPAALAAALGRAIGDRAWREAGRAPARALVAEKFDAAVNPARWLELFETLGAAAREKK